MRPSKGEYFMGHRSFAQVVLLAVLSLAVTAGCGGRGRRGGGGGGGNPQVDSGVPRDSGGAASDAGAADEDECPAPGDRACTSSTTFEQCTNVGGTLRWTPQTCGANTTCQGGECVPTSSGNLNSQQVCTRLRRAQCQLIVQCCSSELDCAGAGAPSQLYSSVSSCMTYVESDQGACPNDGNEYSESALNRCESDYATFDCTSYLVDQTYPSSCDAAATPL